jgi:hypothetical protein
VTHPRISGARDRLRQLRGAARRLALREKRPQRQTSWRRRQSAANPSPIPNSLLTGKNTGIFSNPDFRRRFDVEFDSYFRPLTREFPAYTNRELFWAEQGINSREQRI